MTHQFDESAFHPTFGWKLYCENAARITQAARRYYFFSISKLSDDEYSRLSAQFSSERKETEERLSAIAEELKKEERNLENVTRFTKIIAKYLDIKELNKTVLNELIDKIEVHEAEKIDGKRVQKVDIYYRFVGNLN